MGWASCELPVAGCGLRVFVGIVGNFEKKGTFGYFFIKPFSTMAKTYKELDVYNISFDLFIRVHQFTFRLPKHELYELGSQLRRSADSVNSNIVEGYGRKNYKNDFLKFLIYSHSSNDETINHLKKISLLYQDLAEEAIQLMTEYDLLGGKMNNFVKYVRKNWRT